MAKPKYHNGQVVNFAGKKYNVKSVKTKGTVNGYPEYVLESLLPDKQTGIYETCFDINEVFITK